MLSFSGSLKVFVAVEPCEMRRNTGVMRRRVDVRWRLQAPDIDALVRTQL